jgi:hypothetical protein
MAQSQIQNLLASYFINIIEIDQEVKLFLFPYISVKP